MFEHTVVLKRGQSLETDLVYLVNNTHTETPSYKEDYTHSLSYLFPHVGRVTGLMASIVWATKHCVAADFKCGYTGVNY